MIKKRKKTAIFYKGKSYSYCQLCQYSTCYAQHFSKITLPKKVLIFSENSAEYFFAFYGALRCQAMIIPVDIQSTDKELTYMIEDCQPDIIFTSSDKRYLINSVLETYTNHPCYIITPEDIDISSVETLPITEIPEGEPEQTMLIIYTSGTTGTPKGVMLSYKNVLFNIHAVSDKVPIYQADRNVMVLLPLHHSFPLIGSLIAPIYVGATVYIADSLSSEAILKTLKEGKIALIIGVPRLYDTLAKGIMEKINARFITRLLYKTVKKIGSDNLSKLVFKSVHKKFGGFVKYLVSGGAALSVETAQVFKTLGFYVLEGYGMTETAPMISFTRPGKRKIGYAGEILPDIQIAFTKQQEILVKGDNVMQGYYQRPEETAEILKDGWLHTGDTGFLNRYGLKLTGRIKEIIVTSSGKNINPAELELELLKKSPLIKEAGVFMADDSLQVIIVPQLSEFRINSNISMKATFKDIIADFNLHSIPYKRIKRLHIFSEELPKTRLGKIQRFKLPSLVQDREDKNRADDLTEKSEVFLLLKKFIENETGFRASGNDHFEIDLAMDSLSRVALLAYLEHTFGICINEKVLEKYSTLNSLTEYVEKHLQVIECTELSWKEILSSKYQDIKLPKSGVIHFLMSYLIKLLFHLSYRYRGKGEKNIPDEPCIIVANHRSAIDGHIITSRMKNKMIRKTFLFAKKKHWKSSFARFMALKNNIILIDVNENLRSSLQYLSSVLKKGKNIIIFPEGTRSKNNTLLQFKETFAILSKELNVPIIPVTIQGSERAVYHSIKIPRFFARINVEFLEPIYPENHTTISIKEKVENIIYHQLKLKKK